jgi:glutathione S-transferase
MKLYYARGACSLADRICLHEAGIPATFEMVDIKTKTTEAGSDFLAINPKGYVPALVLDSGETITENIAVLSWIAGQAPALIPAGELGQIRLIEALAFIAAEIHHGFKAFFHGGSIEERAEARTATSRRMQLMAAAVQKPYLFGASFTPADAYLFVTLRWARQFRVPVPALLDLYFEAISSRDSVRRALAEEALH